MKIKIESVNDRLMGILEKSWDDFVESFESEIGKNFWTKYYWTGYHFVKNGDVDGEVCGEIRKYAIEKLVGILDESENLSK